MTARGAVGPGTFIDPVALIRSGPAPADSLTSTQRSHWWRAMEWGITALTVLLVSFPVMNSVATADWVADMPDLRFVGIVALLLAAALAAAPLHWAPALLVSLPLGAALVLWQVLTVDTVAGQPFFFDRFEDLWFRLEDWFKQAFNSGITTDNLPFVLFVTSMAWLLVFFGSFAVFRGRQPWLLIVVMGVMLSINVSYLDGQQWDYNFAFFAAGAALLVMRTSLLGRMERWRAEGATFPDFISVSFLAATLLAIVALMIVSRALPRPDESETLADVWSGVTSPFGDLSDEFERLFSGIDSQRGAPIHSFSDVFVLQGDISPGDGIVVRVASPEPGLLRGATYDRYTTRGWQQSGTVTSPLGEDERVGGAEPEQPYAERRAVTARLSVESSPDALFSFGTPLSVDRDVQVEETAPTVMVVDLTDDPDAVADPALRETVVTFQERSRERMLTEAETLGLVPEGYEVVAIGNSEGGQGIESVTVESEPSEADVVALRPTDTIRAGFTYQVTGSVSSAPAEALRESGLDYPLWVRERFLQLPSDLDEAERERLQALVVDVGRQFGAATPYDLAVALEAYLAASPLLDASGQPVLDDEGNVRPLYPFTTDVEAAPVGVDAVSWFLFENVDEDGHPVGGYFDYYASSMAVLLRSAGVPARVSTGYVLSEENFDSRTRTYIVRGRHAFAWVEVFFPGYGWVDFDPTPTETGLEFEGIAGTRAAAQRFRPFASDIFEGGEELIDFQALDLLLQSAQIGDLDDIDLGRSRDDGGFNLWFVLGPLVGVGALGLVGGSGAAAWRWSLRGLGPAERSWKATQRLASWAGVPPEAAETPAEFAADLGDAIHAPAAAATLAEQYTRVRFGRKTLAETDVAEVATAWHSVRGRLVRKLLHLPTRPRDEAGGSD